MRGVAIRGGNGVALVGAALLRQRGGDLCCAHGRDLAPQPLLLRDRLGMLTHKALRLADQTRLELVVRARRSDELALELPALRMQLRQVALHQRDLLITERLRLCAQRALLLARHGDGVAEARSVLGVGVRRGLHRLVVVRLARRELPREA